MQGSKNYFQRALESTHDATIIAWCHLYLGRISDLQEDRPAALEQYRAALAAAGSGSEVKAAAEKGLQQPYEPPGQPKPADTGDDDKDD
jgi:hypothetical protein